eukprot:236444_1
MAAWADEGSDSDGLFDNLPLFGKKANVNNNQQIDELKQRLKQLEWQNVELKHQLSMKPMSRQELSQLWDKPFLSVEMVCEFMDRLPKKHKEKIWQRHAKGDHIPNDKTVSCLHSILAICIKIKERSAKPPTLAQIKNKLVPFAQAIQKHQQDPSGLNSVEFHTKLSPWMLQRVANDFSSSHRQLKQNTKTLLSKQDRDDAKIMSQCVHKTVQDVYGFDRSMDVLIDNAGYNELQQMYSIIQQAKGIKPGDDGNATNSGKDDDEKAFISMLSPLYRLPPNCMLRMCMLLSRLDVNQLKCVSHDMSIVCCQLMRLYSFRVCNVNKLLMTPQLYTNTVGLLAGVKGMNCTKYKGDTSLGELYFEWERLYDVPIKYQLVYRMGFVWKREDHVQLNALSKEDRFCFLLDERNVVIISKDNKPGKVLMETGYDMKGIINSNAYNLCILQYFDAIKQCLFFKQVLMVKQSVTAQGIVDYVLKRYIALDELQGMCNDEMIKHGDRVVVSKRVVETKNGSVVSSERLESTSAIDDSGNVSESQHIVLILEMDHADKSKEIDKLQSEYKNNKVEFCLDANAFCDKLMTELK